MNKQEIKVKLKVVCDPYLWVDKFLEEEAKLVEEAIKGMIEDDEELVGIELVDLGKGVNRLKLIVVVRKRK